MFKIGMNRENILNMKERVKDIVVFHRQILKQQRYSLCTTNESLLCVFYLLC